MTRGSENGVFGLCRTAAANETEDRSGDEGRVEPRMIASVGLPTEPRNAGGKLAFVSE